MEKRIIVLKKAVSKENIGEGLCCRGAVIPLLI